MATDKKSFLLYCDLIHTVSKMPNDKAGVLFKHILQYVNDENPTTEDLIIQLTFEPIKQSLKRDLQKYENIRLKNIENANKRWNKKNATAYDGIPNDTKNAVSDSVSVSVSVSDNDIKENIDSALPLKFSFFNSMISYGFEKQLVSEWISVRKTKKLSQTETAFKNFIIEVEKTKADKNEILTECIVKSWGGFKSEWYAKENISSSKTERPEQYKKMVF